MSSSTPWQRVRHAVISAVLARGVHDDLIASSNSYLRDTLTVFQENFGIEYVDPRTQYTHTLNASDAYFVLPRTPEGLLDSAYRAMHRENYESVVKGTLHYTVTDADGGVVYRSETRDFEFFTYPVLMNTELCTSTVGACTAQHVVVSSNFSLPAFCVNRTFKVCPLEETFALDTPLMFQVNRCEIRSQFSRPSRKYRTNSTLRLICKIHKDRRQRHWAKTYTYEFEVPYEYPKSLVSIQALVVLLGSTPSEFRNLVHGFAATDVVGHALDRCLDLLFAAPAMRYEQAMAELVSHMSRAKEQSTPAEQQSFVLYTMEQEFFPNAHTNVHKTLCLARCVARLLRNSTPYLDLALTSPDLDDKRSYVHKRVESVGYKLCVLLRKYTKHLNKRVQYHIRKALVQNALIRKPKVWTKIVSKQVIKLTASVRNGNWDVKSDTSDSNLNKTQLLGTGFCTDGIVVEAHKIVKSFLRRSTSSDPLLTHPTQHGRVCMYLTPESERCAVTRFKAVGARITPNPDHAHVARALTWILARTARHGVEFKYCTALPAARLGARVFSVLNTYGYTLGYTTTPRRLYEVLRGYRRRGVLPRYTGFAVHRREFRILVNAGRIQRPVLVAATYPALHAALPVLEHARQPMEYLVTHGFAEYLCADEEYHSYVLTDLKPGGAGSHIEIHGALSMSLTVARLFANHNQGPRRMYTGNLEKRAMSYKVCEDFGTTVSHSLWYAQAPVMSEIVEHTLQSRTLEPNGCSVRVAIMSLAGNIEDAWIVSRQAVQRGLLVSSEQRIITHVASHKSTFARPSASCTNRSEQWKYAALKGDGTPRLGETIRAGMAVVGKTIAIKTASGIQGRCVSKFLPGNDKDYVVQHVSTYPETCVASERQLVRVVLQRSHTPQIGDKFFLSHGQKGTIGQFVDDWDMPFSVTDGATPDLVLNVCSMMRVTMGLLLEMLGSRVRALRPGRVSQYETLFQHAETTEQRTALWSQILVELGYSASGKDRFRDGKTGRLITAPLYHGLASLRALKQLSKDKLRCRDRGRVNELSRQTTVGRKNKGGLKAGEMELFNMVSFGAPFLKLNMTYNAADKFILPICTGCSNVALANASEQMCGVCGTGEKVKMVNVAYITNLITQELETLGIGLKFDVH